MLEAQKVSVNQIKVWRDQILNGDLTDISAVYQQLAELGYHYASWAYGVATADTITGNGALEFMQSVAKEHGHNLTFDETNKIRHAMALGYLDMLANKAKTGSVSNDITYKEMRKFHNDVFENKGIDINYWTLYQPMAMIEKYASGKLADGTKIKGDQIVELVWAKMWATKGTSFDSWMQSTELFAIMNDAKNGYIYLDDTGMPISSGAMLRQLDSLSEGFSLALMIQAQKSFKKIEISTSDTALAAQWVKNTKVIAPLGDYWSEVAHEGSKNKWYDQYATTYDREIGLYFANQQNNDRELQQFKFNWDLTGGKAVTQWIIAAVLNTNIINSSNTLVNSINQDNFIDKGLAFVFDPSNGHRQEIAGQQGKFEFKYQLAFIDDLPDKLFSMLQTLEQQGNKQLVSLYLNALMQLNPVVILNPDKPPVLRTINDMGEDWIKIRTWMIQEMRFAQAKEYNEVLNGIPGLDGIPSIFVDKRTSYQQQKSIIESIRKQYGFGAEEAILFRDEQTGQSWSTDASASENVHQVIMLANSNRKAVNGGNLADVIIGGKANDTINGGAGDDYLIGGAGNDTLKGGTGNDILDGGNGMDKYYFNTGDGQDKIYDSDGKGSIFINNKQLSTYKWTAIEKNIWLSADNKWQMQLDEISGNLVIQSLENKNDVLTIAGWNYMVGGKLGITLPKPNNKTNKVNKIVGDSRPKIIREEGHFDLDERYTGRYYWGWKQRNPNGTVTNGVVEKDFEDVIKGTEGADEIQGLGGGDAIDGMAGNDIILGGDGNDLLAGGGGSDIIKGGAGDDYIWANNHLTIGDRIRPNERWRMPATGKKVIYAGPNWGVYLDKNDSIIFDGVDSTFNDSADTGGDFLYGGDGSDYIIGSNLNDYIEADSTASNSTEQGNDVVYGMSGNDYILGGKGDDSLNGDGIINQGSLNSIPQQSHGDDYIDGGDGNDEIIGGGGHDVLLGGNGNDRIYGDNYTYEKGIMLEAQYHGNDTIDGGDGDDEITGGGGHDYLYGGNGNDIICGDDGDANGRHPELNGNDHIWGGAGNDQLDGGYGDDVIHGDDDNDFVLGGAGNDELYGDNGDDHIQGDNLDENINVHGNDYLDGGNGNDLMIGGAGDDWIIGGNGDDILWGDDCRDNHELNSAMAGNDYLSGGAGADMLIGGYGNDTLDGGTGNDKLFGGAGCDTIYGGDGDDGITGDFSEGVGLDIIVTDNSFNDTIYAGAGNDNVEGHLGDDLIYGGTGDDHLFGDLTNDPKNHNPQHNGNDIIYGEDGNDYIDGGYGNDLLDGGNGNDSIFGGGGNDVIYGGDGNDYLSGGDASNTNEQDTAGGNDIIYGGAGNDTLLGGEGDDLLQGDEGDDYLDGGNGNDNLYGGEGNDWLIGGRGNDYLNGGSGDDKYVVNRGDGITTIEDYSGQTVVIVDVPLDNLSVSAYAQGVKVTNGINGDEIYLKGYYLDGRTGSLDMNNLLFARQDGSSNSYAVRTLQKIVDTIHHHHANGYEHIIDGDDMDNELIGTIGKDLIYGYGGNDILHGNGGDDLLDGGEGNDILYGDAGDDKLYGGAGADTLEGGSGDDLLIGGSGQDRYVFRAGHGQDEIYDEATSAVEGDIIDFVDYRSDELWLQQSGDDLIIGHSGSDNQVRLDDWFANASCRQYQIHTADDKNFTAAQLQQLIGAMAGFSQTTATNRVLLADEAQQLIPSNSIASHI